MAKIEVTSKQYWLNAKDFIKGLIISMLTAAITIVTTSLESGVLHFDWRTIGIAAGAAGGSYLLKNWLQPAQVKQTVTNQEVDEIKTNLETEKAAK